VLKVLENEPGCGRPPAALSGRAPVLPKIAFAQLQLLNALYRRRSALDFRFVGRSATIAAAWPPPFGEPSRRYRVHFAVDGTAGEAVLCGSLIDAITSAVDPRQSLVCLKPEHAGVLVEFALRDELAALEQNLGCRLAIAAVYPEHQAPAGADPSVLTFLITVEGLGRSWCELRLAYGDAAKLVELLGRCPAKLETAPDLPVTLCVRVAATTLSVGEISRLSPGDVVLVEQRCRKPHSAVAVIAEHLVAPVELTAAGGKLVTAPMRGRGSAWEWSMENVAGKPSRDGEQNGVLDDLPVKLVFELGRVELSLREIRQLAPGAVVALARPVEESVDVVANGRRIGRGNLVQVGDSLGVRLARLFEDV
jgi:type III secretion protein Q